MAPICRGKSSHLRECSRPDRAEALLVPEIYETDELASSWGCPKTKIRRKNEKWDILIVSDEILGTQSREFRRTVVVCALFRKRFILEIADVVKGLRPTILNWVMESRNRRIWTHFTIEGCDANGNIHLTYEADAGKDHDNITSAADSSGGLLDPEIKRLLSIIEMYGINVESLKMGKTDWELVICDIKDLREALESEQYGDAFVARNKQVESHLPNFQFPGLTMNEFCVGLVENNSRLESENTDSKQEGDKDVNIILRPVKGDEDESHLLNLPLHVLGMVMEFSVGVEYLKFRSACKTCHLEAPLIPWNNEKASKRLQKYSLPTPWLIAFDKHKGIITFTDPMFGDNGSLILKYIRELPQLRDYDIFSFSAPPTSLDCMVVGITIDRYESFWRRILLDIHGDDYFSSLTVFGRNGQRRSIFMEA
ncbi:hypothetical protein Tco_1370694 [Tanacetum coccineum]